MADVSYRLVWTVKVERDLPVGCVIFGQDVPYGSGATPDEALARLRARLDLDAERVAVQHEVAAANEVA